ncbi:MAG: hypothetical protein JKY67_08395 [Pseudomonadales bacterium]|nr:hypothetical protein [Pseudomonadales bacterium]
MAGEGKVVAFTCEVQSPMLTESVSKWYEVPEDDAQLKIVAAAMALNLDQGFCVINREELGWSRKGEPTGRV